MVVSGADSSVVPDDPVLMMHHQSEVQKNHHKRILMTRPAHLFLMRLSLSLTV